MSINLSAELAQLLKFAGDTAGAIRMYSHYNSGAKAGDFTPFPRRDPDTAPIDIMFLADAITQLLEIGAAVERGDLGCIARQCDSVLKVFECYEVESPEFSISGKSTFDFWRQLVKLDVAKSALTAIRDKATAHTGEVVVNEPA